jgi:soluble lytic murein transglycosylase
LGSIFVTWLQKGGILAVLFLMLISMLNFSTHITRSGNEESSFVEIRQHLSEICGVMISDAARIAAVQKIIRIINDYNSKLDESLKYQIANEIYEMTLRYNNLDIDLICATITHESAKTWRPDVVSPAGALGLMQIMPYVGRSLSEIEGIEWTTPEAVLFDPIYNIRLGCRYLSSLINLYHLDGGLAAYNGGAYRAAKWLKSGRNNSILASETRGYVPAILELYGSFRN